MKLGKDDKIVIALVGLYTITGFLSLGEWKIQKELNQPMTTLWIWVYVGIMFAIGLFITGFKQWKTQKQTKLNHQPIQAL